MTTENKIPPNWPEALAMADKIAKICLEGFKETDDLPSLSRFRNIGVLVGLTEEDFQQK